MTISTSNSSIIVAGTGSAASFNFSFIGDAASDIFVSFIDASGNITPLTSSQYSITLNPPATNQLWGIGGVVTYPISGSPIAAGTYLSIQRILPLTQQVSIQNQGNFYPKVTEQALDILEMQIQQVASRTGQLRGTWISGLFYSYGDFVLDGINGANTGNYYLCVQANTSFIWNNDLAAGDWVLALNVQNIVAQAVAGATAQAAIATAQANIATTQAGISTTQAGISTTQAANSAASALAAAGTLFGTSSTSNTIGTEAKTFTTQTGLAINPTGGGFLTIANTISPANYMHGQVTSYSGTTLIINVLDTGGSGTFASWNISPSGPQGTSGSGSGTVNTGVTNQLAYYAANGTTVSGDINATVVSGGLTMGTAGVQGSVTLTGSSSGSVSLVPLAAASGTITVPSVVGTLYTTAANSITSAQLATSLTNKTGSGPVVFSTSPTLVTPVLGVATATSINFGGQALSVYSEGTWTPTFSNLTIVGTPTYSGKYKRIGNYIFCTLDVVSTTSTSSNFSLTSFVNLPFPPGANSTLVATNTLTNASYGTGLIQSSGTCNTPTWPAISNVTLSFSYLV